MERILAISLFSADTSKSECHSKSENRNLCDSERLRREEKEDVNHGSGADLTSQEALKLGYGMASTSRDVEIPS